MYLKAFSCSVLTPGTNMMLRKDTMHSAASVCVKIVHRYKQNKHATSSCINDKPLAKTEQCQMHCIAVVKSN